MIPDDFIGALGLPDSALVNQRVPKKMLVENGAPTAADKRRINDGIEEIHWLAALKPNTIGVPEYCDDVQEYLEIAVLSVVLRPDAKAGRLAELFHRAIPYPLFLILVQGDQIVLSLTHKRRAQNEADKFVLDGDSVEVAVSGNPFLSTAVGRQFLDALALSHQPRASLLQLYQGWIDTLVALQASLISGTFCQAISKEAAIARLEAVKKCCDLEARITSLRNAAAKEKQMGRRVELNLEIKELRALVEIARKAL
ncbi:DUF4391 domain-containing protein [Pelobacter propionicus]|uniref:DUF4391 domain-containing protein n=1 Tax=Pelobacter propionicus (strain DSM 2379 / NBRC 103807 / OttBd1) TaxID=338966 RepID=A1AKK3_PELPD|nr:DUF4391 domain-containing protein [Pelobacter propionicus]ABK97873.1 conserved hypothetical protein [Pelobacter propionicus DSM 2379]